MYSLDGHSLAAPDASDARCAVDRIFAPGNYVLDDDNNTEQVCDNTERSSDNTEQPSETATDASLHALAASGARAQHFSARAAAN